MVSHRCILGPLALAALLTPGVPAAAAGMPTFGAARTISTGAGVTGQRDAAMADLDGDGRPDIVVASANGDHGRLSVLRNTGGGRFGAIAGSPFATGAPDSGLSAVAAGDVSGDGRPDVVATAASGTATNLLTALFGDGTGRLLAAPGAPFTTLDTPRDVVLADADGDGAPDALTAGATGVEVLLNDGDGTLAAAAATAPVDAVALATGDLDGDGILDAAVAGRDGDGHGVVWIATGDGTGALTLGDALPGAEDPVAIALGDLDGHGLADVIVAGAGGLTILRNDGGGDFTALDPITGLGTVSGLAVDDVDGDGVPDVVVSDAAGGRVGVLLGLDDDALGLSAPGWLAMGAGARAPQVADVDGDAVADLVSIGSTGATVRRGTSLPSPSVAAPGSLGDVVVGATGEPVTVSVTNTGDALLRVRSVSVTGTDADDFLLTRDECSGQDVPKGGEAACAVRVRFAPTALGARNAILHLTHASGTVDVPLTAQGVVAPPVVVADPPAAAASDPAPATTDEDVPPDDVTSDDPEDAASADSDTAVTPAVPPPPAVKVPPHLATARAGRPVKVSLTVTEPVTVTLKVRRGTRTVATVKVALSAGRRSISWNGRVAGRAATAGTYRLALRAVTADGRVASAATTVRLVRR